MGAGDPDTDCSVLLPESVRYSLPLDVDGGGVDTLAIICSALEICIGSVAGGTSSILVFGGLNVSWELFRRRLRKLFLVWSVSIDSRPDEFCLTQLSALSLFLDALLLSLLVDEKELVRDPIEEVRRKLLLLELVKLGVRGALYDDSPDGWRDVRTVGGRAASFTGSSSSPGCSYVGLSIPKLGEVDCERLGRLPPVLPEDCGRE